MTRGDYKKLLRICKDFIKLNVFIKNKGLSQSAISRFIRIDDYNMISDTTLDLLTSEIYNACCCYKELYEDIKKIA